MFDWRRRSAKKSVVALSQWFVCLLCGLTPFVFSGPQQEATNQQTNAQQKVPVFTVQTSMVVVDVTVRDAKGKLVDGLKREDFKVYEDNVPQSIVTFSAESVAIGPAAVADQSAGKPETIQAQPQAIVNLALNPTAPVKKEDLAGKRLIILFFDLSSLQTENLVRSVDAARDFLAKQTGPQDLMAVATYSSTLSLVQDFTNDRELLLKTLKDISSEESEESAAQVDTTSDTSSDDVYVPDSVQFNVFNTDRRLSALETLAKMYREFPERKSLIYFSSGVTTTGVENNAQIRSTVDNANRSNMSIYTVDSQGLVALPPGGDASHRSTGSSAFNGSGMMQQRTSLSSSQETLITLSHDTGGKSFTDSNDLSLAMKQAQVDTNVYYVLGYLSSNSKEDGKYRRIRVELNRPGLKIAHRPGYFASKAFGQLTQQEKDLQLSQAMNVERPFVDVPLILEADYFRKDNTTNYVPISIEILGDGLKFEEKGANREGKFEFVAQAIDPKGRVTGIARDAVSLKLPVEKAEKLKAGGIFYSTGFQLRSGAYKLRFLVRDNVTGKLGSFEQPINVPAFDLKKLSLSSIVLGNQLANARGDTGSVTHQGATRRFQQIIPTYDPLVTGNKKVVPSIGYVFLARQTVYVYFQVYGAAEDKETQKPCIETDLILLRDNTKILETKPQYVQSWTNERGAFAGMMGRGRGDLPAGGMGGRGGMDFPGRGGTGPMGGFPGMQGFGDRKGESTVAISMPLKNLKQGTYMLQVHVRDAIADTNLFERVPIVIQ
ncbi:MAG TPA: VWA domain-containing protein [Acidobacteriota bacterium]|nr:VWA domain-containing protein [Acidobacteriota bacterium]